MFASKSLTARAAVVLGVGALALTAACGGTSSSDKTKKVSLTKGGTLYFLSNTDFEHLDPARNYVTDAGDFGRLLYRTLTTYRSTGGLKGTQVVPDLATDLGTPSDGAKTWTYHLKKGLKFEDGTVITSKDVKYGVERTFSDLLPEGAPYIHQALVNTDKYAGPYTDKAKKGLSSIETPDDSTIVFHFTKPFADFPYAAALTTTAPVPEAKDTGVKYDGHPISSGPYMIESYARGKTITFVRNPYWDAKSDPNRGAYPDKIVGQLGLDAATIDQRIEASNGEDAHAFTFKVAETENYTKFQTDPALKSRVITGYDNSTIYTAMNTVRGATKDVKVRQAIEIAWPKFAARLAAGGPSVGDFAHSVIPPTLSSHRDFNLYDTGDKGDPVKAKQMLADAGYPNGVKVSFGVAATPTAQKVAAVLKDGLSKAGITLNIQLIDPSKYYDTIGTPARQPDLVNYGWIPDWPSASTVIPPLFTCSAIKPQGNNNPANYCNKDFDAISDQASAETDQKKADELWAKADHKLMEDAVVIPRYFGKTLYIVGSGVKNLYSWLPMAGQLDVANLAVG